MISKALDAGLVDDLVGEFQDWLDNPENQPHFYSLQDAYHQWLFDVGYESVEDDYSFAVAIILVYLSRAICNPTHRRIHFPPDKDGVSFAVLPGLAAQYTTTDKTFWEFLTEENFRQSYENWKADAIANPDGRSK